MMTIYVKQSHQTHNQTAGMYPELESSSTSPYITVVKICKLFLL